MLTQHSINIIQHSDANDVDEGASVYNGSLLTPIAERLAMDLSLQLDCDITFKTSLYIALNLHHLLQFLANAYKNNSQSVLPIKKCIFFLF